MKNKEVTLKISSDFPDLFRNFQTYYEYANHLMQDYSFYLEPIKDGILLIYGSFDDYQEMSKIFTLDEIIKFTELHKEKITPELILSGILDKSRFPTNGIELRHTPQLGPIDPMLIQEEREMRAILPNTVAISVIPDKEIILHFTNYEDFLIYVSYYSAALSGIFIED